MAGPKLRVVEKRPWGQAALDRNEQYELKRQTVLRTAARAFTRKGFFQTSLTDIARELNINKATLYHYFTSKDEIIYEIHRTAIESITKSEIAEVASRAKGVENLKSFIGSYIDMLLGDFGACLVTTGIDVLEQESRARCVAGRRQINSMLSAILEHGIKDGSIARCDVKVTTPFIFGALNWICNWYHADGALTPGELKENAIAFILRGVAARGTRSARS